MRSLAATVPGWPASNTQEPFATAEDTSKAIGNLVAQGVLTFDEIEGKQATPTTDNSTVASIALDANNPRHRTIGLLDIIRFILACTRTLWLLRCRSLRKAVEAMSENKALHGAQTEFDAVLAQDLVAIFRRLRSFTFTAHRRCLFHALALVDFLSRYQVYPQFVMGVKVDPWAAHSWVQYGDYILDGTPEQVRFFTPILVA